MRRLAGCSFLLAAVLAAAAHAQSTGGASVPAPVKVAVAVCATGQQWACATGQQLTLRGAGMDGVDQITFLGAKGKRDDQVARPTAASAKQLTLVVPRSAKSGQLRVHSTVAGAANSPKPLAIAAGKTSRSHAGGASSPVTSSASDGSFPINGHHDMGQSATNRFGGGRGHQGQDMFAACGTPLVAVRDATVQFAAYQSEAGNYVVLQDASGQSYTYMHMKAASLLKTGQRVRQGQRVGFVGQTGHAEGCHLHFELWTAPGWYSGGHAIDPLPQLAAWHRHDSDH